MSHSLSRPSFSWEGLLAWGLAWVDVLVGTAVVVVVVVVVAVVVVMLAVVARRVTLVVWGCPSG